MKFHCRILQRFLLPAAAVVLIAGCSREPQVTATDKGEVTLAELNKAYATWEMISVTPVPKTVEGLTNSPVLKGKRLPVPPPGQKLVLDPARRQVVFADQ